MRFTKILTLVLCFAATSVFAQEELPATALKTLGGEKVIITDAVDDEKITILSFWATWCKPCKLELDNMADLYEDWQADYNVEIIAITIDDSRQLRKVQPMVDTKQWDYTVLSDVNRDLHKALGGVDIPYTVVVKGGEVLYTHSGYKLGDEEALEDKIAGWAEGEEPVKKKKSKSKKKADGKEKK
ncbi:MAG: TlpA family protein disulfide reductase [Saprospiraceae bacterium]